MENPSSPVLPPIKRMIIIIIIITDDGLENNTKYKLYSKPSNLAKTDQSTHSEGMGRGGG